MEQRLIRRTFSAILVSLGVHAALVLCLCFSHPYRRDAGMAPVGEVPITIEVGRPETPPPTGGSVPLAEATPPHLPDARRSRRLHLYPLPPPAQTRPAALPAGDVPASPGGLAMRTDGRRLAERKPLDLYRRDAIERSLGQGSTDQPSVAAALPSEDVASETGAKRIARWLRESSAEANTRDGDVPPIWRDIQRHIEETFRPPRKVVSEASTAVLLGRQLLGTGRPAAPARTERLPAELRAREATLAADVMAGQEAAARPAAWLRTDIVVEVGSDGGLRSAEIAASSGRADLDRLALEAVRAAVAERPVVGGCRRATTCTTRIRWAVEAAVRVQPPPLMVPASGKTGGPGGISPFVLGFSFDEAKGKARRVRAFENEVQTRIELLSIE